MSTQVVNEYKTPSQKVEASASPAAVTPAALVGTWTNVDHATRDLVKVVIAAKGTSITIHGFGACTPTPCDWGVVSGLAYAANVSSTAAVAFTAQYHFSFSQVTLTGHIVGKQLLVESFTHFTDGSGRDDYFVMDTMSR
jgi:hypothetical protein